jgi:hypothetical protein
MESAQTEKGNRAKVANKANQQTPQGIVRRFLAELASHFDATWGRCGHEAASGKSILRVCFSEGDTENRIAGG